MCSSRPKPTTSQLKMNIHSCLRKNKSAFVDFDKDELDSVYICELSYPNYLKNFQQFSVYLENKGTNNIYVDSHVDSRLYKINREEHPYELMYIATKDCVYVGIHARNTRRLPFDMTVYFGFEQVEDETRVPLELQSPLPLQQLLTTP